MVEYTLEQSTITLLKASQWLTFTGRKKTIEDVIFKRKSAQSKWIGLARTK